jgi:hypothetical protein
VLTNVTFSTPALSWVSNMTISMPPSTNNSLLACCECPDPTQKRPPRIVRGRAHGRTNRARARSRTRNRARARSRRRTQPLPNRNRRRRRLQHQ